MSLFRTLSPTLQVPFSAMVSRSTQRQVATGNSGRWTVAIPSPRPSRPLAPIAEPSEGLRRQAGHVAYEYAQLMGTPENHYTDTTTAHDIVKEGILDFFNYSLKSGATESDLHEDAILAEDTLRQIRTLKDKKHFFRREMGEFIEHLPRLGPKDNAFGLMLFRDLHDYCQKRREASSEFLRPFGRYCQEIIDVIERHNGGRFSITTPRIKDEKVLLDKLTERLINGKWDSMDKDFFDLIGIRILVRHSLDIEPVTQVVRGALLLHQADLMNAYDASYYYQALDEYTERHDKQSGYRANHVNVHRYVKAKQRAYATAEIQIMQEAMDQCAAIERCLYKRHVILAPDVRADIADYFSKAILYTRSIADGKPAIPPLFDDHILDRIENALTREEMDDRVKDMKELVKTYQERAERLVTLF